MTHHKQGQHGNNGYTLLVYKTRTHHNHNSTYFSWDWHGFHLPPINGLPPATNFKTKVLRVKGMKGGDTSVSQCCTRAGFNCQPIAQWPQRASPFWHWFSSEVKTTNVFELVFFWCLSVFFNSSIYNGNVCTPTTFHNSTQSNITLVGLYMKMTLHQHFKIGVLNRGYFPVL